MAKEDLKKALRVCEKMEQTLSDIGEVVDTWAAQKEKLHKKYEKEMGKYRELAEEIPEDWHNLVGSMFAWGKIFGSPARLKKFLKQNKQLLDSEEREAVRFYTQNPWFYSVFSVEDVVGENFLRIHDYCGDADYLINSEGVYNAHREGKKLFLSLLFYNGECCQAFGLIIAFTGFTIEDIRCYARYTSYHFENTGDLETAISYNPFPYFLLSRFSEEPTAMHDNVPVVFCGHSLKVKDFSPDECGGNFTVEEEAGVFRYTLKGSVEPYSYSHIYYDSEERLLLLQTSGLERYRSLVAGLKDSYDFPADPSWHVGTLMGAALIYILGVHDPIFEYAVLFGGEPDLEEEDELDVLSTVMSEMAEALNSGRDFSPEETAQKYDIPVDIVRVMRDGLSGELDERFKIDIKGGFDDFTPPSPLGMLMFNGTFQENDEFGLDHNAKTGKLFETLKPRLRDILEDSEYESLTLKKLPQLLEDIFCGFNAPLDYGDGYHIFLYSIYLLSKKGKTFHKAKDYAVELLRSFWLIFLDDGSRKEIKRFTRDYKFFCFEILYRGGLIDIDRELDRRKAGKADFKIKTTEFFDQWIRFFAEH